MKVALAQINTTVGDLAGNKAKILAAYRRGVEAGVDLVMFPELTITGYPPRDLLLKKSFIAENLAVLERLAAATGRTALLVGYVGENKNAAGARGDQFRRAAAERKDCGDAGEDAAADVRCVRRGPLFRAGDGESAGDVRRRQDRPDDLRGHLERRGFLAGTALPAQSAGGTGGGAARGCCSTFRRRRGAWARTRRATGCCAAWRRRRNARWCFATRSAGMMNWFSTAGAWRSTRRGN